MLFLGINRILIAAAVIPAVVLLVYVYRADRLERESHGMLLSLVVGGIFSTFLAIVAEKVGGFLLGLLVPQQTLLYYLLRYFVVVGGAEEGAKYVLLKRKTWDSPEFNCQFDGVLYAVFVSLGFALWENISYVLQYGFGTALIRAITAVPGHACFGVFMGVWYGLAKRHESAGNAANSRLCRRLAVICPILLHGTYDFIASVDVGHGVWTFVVFVLLLFFVSYRLVKRFSSQDTYI